RGEGVECPDRDTQQERGIPWRVSTLGGLAAHFAASVVADDSDAAVVTAQMAVGIKGAVIVRHWRGFGHGVVGPRRDGLVGCRLAARGAAAFRALPIRSDDAHAGSVGAQPAPRNKGGVHFVLVFRCHAIAPFSQARGPTRVRMSVTVPGGRRAPRRCKISPRKSVRWWAMAELETRMNRVPFRRESGRVCLRKKSPPTSA